MAKSKEAEGFWRDDLKEQRDYCGIIRGIEADPFVIVRGLTIGDFLAMRVHLSECVECIDSVERVRAKYPEKPSIGEAPNEN